MNRRVQARFGGPFLSQARSVGPAPTATTRFGGPFLSLTKALIVIFLTGAPIVSSAQTKGKQPGSAPSASEQALDRFTTYFKERATAHGIVGAGLRVVGENRPWSHASFGMKDRATASPVDEATIFHWASITKTFTGIAIMQLRDRGRLSLDDAIVKYVPELEAVHNTFGPMNAITIRQLLSHTAGFRAGTWPFGGDKPWQPFEPTEWSQLVSMMPYTEVEFAPGSKYSYSNPGLVYLGRVIEKISGEPWETYIDKNILRPLGMSRAFFDRAPYHLLKDRSHSYTVEKGKLEEARFDFDSGITVSNGGLNAPLTDMEKYVRFLLGHAETADGAQVLARKSLEEMWRPVARVEETAQDQVDIGLCFFIEKRGSRRLIGHSGSQNGFISHLYLDAGAHAGYVVSFNTDATDDVPVPNTRKLDSEIREFWVASVAPALEAASAAATASARVSSRP
ncbi:MAG: serine hydrolase domain-containing protein [Vicinamibacteria bacterium]